LIVTGVELTNIAASLPVLPDGGFGRSKEAILLEMEQKAHGVSGYY
jgi:hypothetical protein